MTDRLMRYGLVAGVVAGLALTVSGGASGEEAAPAPEGGGAAPAAAPAAAPTPAAAPAAAPAPADGTVSRTHLPDGTDLRAPTAEELRALEILEQEYERYARQSRGFAATVNTIVRREYNRRRERITEEYERQIQEEEALLREARRRAIEEFEAFLERYPNDPRYTPDAMFRLAELYYEDSYETFLDEADRYAELQERREAGEDVELPPEPVKDFSRTVNLFRRLIADYPDYRHIDGALYLLGFCLNETGNFEEARIAWLALVCANHFRYEGPVAREEPTDDEEHPAATLRAAEEPAGAFTNEYETCRPRVEDSDFFEESWLRIGEYHFDYDYTAHGLDFAIAAYRNAMSDPEGPFYDKALYKLAWSYYRADRYTEAIRHFAMLVEYADERRERTGEAGSEMRPEAIQYLGICFAEDDWNHDNAPDDQRGIDRLQDAALMPQDRPYTAEVYFQTGDTYFDLARYSDAIEVYELALRRWPNALRAPQVVERIAQAHERNREFEEAISARGRLSDYGADSEWALANADEHPEAVREAEQLARNALYDDAVRHHQIAQSLRARCVAEENPELCRRSVDEYNLAATGYREYLEQYPNDPDAYEIGYNLAEAMFFSGQHREAAAAYAQVRDSNLDDRFREQAAFRTIKALEALRDAEVRAGRLTLREEAPEASGTPPTVTPIPIPEIIAELNEARDTYARLLPRSTRTPTFRYQTAQIFYRHGHWDEARTRFGQLYEEYCTTDPVGFYSWQNLVNIAGALNDLPEAERLARAQIEHACAAAAPECEGEDCPEVEGPEGGPTVAGGADQAREILTSAEFRHAFERFQEAERTHDRAAYEESAQMFVDAVGRTPRHPEAAQALNNAALAYEAVDLYERAMNTWRRIVEEYPESEFVDRARFRLAYNAYRFFEYDEAVTHYQILARTSKSADIRRDSILNTATILTNLQQYDKAAPFWRQYAEPGVAPDDRARAEAAFRAAEMSYKREDWNGAIRELRGYITEYRSSSDAAPYRVKAAYYIAQAYKKSRQDREYWRALQGVIDEFRSSGEKAGSLSAEYAAEARFRIVDQDIGELERFKIAGKAETINQQIEDGARRVLDLEKAYGTVTEYRRPEWTVAAHYRIGYAYELYAKAMLDSEPPSDLERLLISKLPRELQRDLARMPAKERAALLQDQTDAFEQQWRDEMVKRVTGAEDRAVSEYELCVKAARAGNIVSEYTRQAYERLFAYRPDEYPLQREGRTELELDAVAPPPPAAASEPSPYPASREPAKAPSSDATSGGEG